MILFAPFLLSAQAQTAPEMRMETVPGRGYAVTVEPFPITSAEAVQARLQTLAKERCGALTVRFGRFSFDNKLSSTGEQSVANYRQGFQCIDPATDPYQPIAADRKASEADTRSATDFVQRYLASVDKADAAAGMSMFEPMLETTRDEWMVLPKLIRQANANGGVWRAELLNWENNPSGAAHPGAYATFWVSDEHKALAGACGSVMIYRVSRDQYQISQQNIRLVAQSKVDSGGTTADAVRKMCS